LLKRCASKNAVLIYIRFNTKGGDITKGDTTVSIQTKDGKLKSVAPEHKVAKIPHRFNQSGENPPQIQAKICPKPNILAYSKRP